MKRILNLFLAVAVVSLLAMCTSKTTSDTTSNNGDFVELDINALQSMPIEEFDYDSNPAIASIEYFQPHDTIIFPFGIPVIGDSWVAMYHNNVIIFDKDSGKVLASFDRTGEGPEEYVNLFGLGVDRSTRTCHVLTSDSPSKIKTYSFDGEFLSELQMKDKINPESGSFAILDDSYYYVTQNSIRRIVAGKTDDPLDSKPYLLIDRNSGNVIQLPIERVDYKICNRYVPKSPDIYAPNWKMDIKYTHGGENQLIVSEFSNDTIFAVKDDGLTKPIAVKRNWSKDYDNPDLVSVLYAGKRYMIFEILRKTTNHSAETISENPSKSGTYIYDFEKNEFHRYAETGLFMESNGHLFMLRPIYKLMDAADRDEIKDPALLDIIEKSNDESNFVWITYRIAE